MSSEKEVPVITIGKYRGMKIDQLPNSYLRWMVMQQGMPEEWLECAKNKLKQSDYDNTGINISRHAIDMFSKRFLHQWVKENNIDVESSNLKAVGLGTYMAHLAQKAWENGDDISKHRHPTDGIVRVYNGIKWVFALNPKYPEYKELVTVMEL